MTTSTRTFLSRARAIAPALFACALAGTAAAQEVWVGSESGIILKGDAHDGGFQFVSGCGGCVGTINSMVADGNTVWVGDTTGNVYLFNDTTFAIDYAYTVANDAASMVKSPTHVFVGGTNGTIFRVHPTTGTVAGTLSSPFGSSVDAMHLEGSSLVIGSANSFFAEGDSVNGNFQTLGACGGSIRSMARNGDELFLGDVNGNVYRFRFSTHQVGYAYTVPSDNQAMVRDGSHLLIGGTNGNLLRVNSATGAIVATFATGLPIRAIAIGAAPADPGTLYCFGGAGAGCPCGNLDLQGGCANSTSHGAVIHGSGSTSVTADDLVLRVEFIPSNVLSRMYMSTTQNQFPFGDGLMCAGGGGYPAFRFPAVGAGVGGVLEQGPGIVQYSHANFGPTGSIAVGQQWNFQAWFRNVTGPCGTNFNTSSGYSVTFTN